MRILFSLAVLLVLTATQAQIYQFANLKKEDVITAKNHHVSTYLNDFLIAGNVEIDKMKLERKGKNYYLLAHDKNEGLTYLIPLNRLFNRLYTKSMLTYITGCGTSELDLRFFDFKDAPVINCINCEYKLSVYRPLR